MAHAPVIIFAACGARFPPTLLVPLAPARGDVIELDEGAVRPHRRLRTLAQREEVAVERACAAHRATEAEEEAMTLDELVTRAEARKRAAKQATKRALRRLARSSA